VRGSVGIYVITHFGRGLLDPSPSSAAAVGSHWAR
jgi:hypothetical protein